MDALKNRVAIITGGTRGLGLSIAQAYARESAAVVIASRVAKNIEQAVEMLQADGSRASGLVCDTTDLAQVRRLAQHAREQYGRLDIWVNNAGISCPMGPTMHIPPEYIVHQIQTNIVGVYHGSLVAMEHFLPQRSGKLINIGGRGMKNPVPMQNPYGATKAWLRNFTLALAKEYQNTGVGIYLFSPGLVETEMMQHLHFINGYEGPLLRVFRIISRIFANPPEAPAQKAVWLASPATDGETGLVVDLLGPEAIIRGVGRLILNKPSAGEPKVTLVKPTMDIPVRGHGSLLKRRGVGDVKRDYIVHLDDRNLPGSLGNKAINLHRLKGKQFQVPDTLVCSWDAYLDYLRDGSPVLDRVRAELEAVLKPGGIYAVRSSANIEDSLEYSFAGQFKTILDAQGMERVLSAIREIWEATQTEEVQTYLQKTRGTQQELKMAVIIQEMIPPVFSGVAFSRNPITALDEIVVEAVHGAGTALVQDGITPYRWVYKWGNWIQQPEGPGLSLEIIQRVVDETRTISRTFKRDVDLEWVYDGRNLYWLQVREITTAGETNIYSNKMAKELTPGLIKPLVWSVTLPIPGHSWIRILTEVIGKNDLQPDSLAKAFHYRAYHNLGVFGKIFASLGLPRESLEMVMGVAPRGMGRPKFKPGPKTLRHLPRMARFILDKWFFAGKAASEFPRLEAEARSYPLPPSSELDERHLMGTLDRLVDLSCRISYNTILSILLMQIYGSILKGCLGKLGVDFQQFDLTEGMEALKQYDPGVKLEVLNQQFNGFDEGVQEIIRSGDYGAFMQLPGVEPFRQGVAEFFYTFGHLSDSGGDFGMRPWRETPGLVLQLIANFKRPEEGNASRVRFADLPSGGLGGLVLRLFYRRARQFRLFREMYSSLFTYSLMLLRAYYLVLGDRMAGGGLLADREDIYFLYASEVRAFAEGKTTGEDLASLVAQRKDEMQRCKDVILPEVIYGDSLPLILLTGTDKLNGTPTSRGYYTGPAKVVCGLADFQEVQAGDVLVIPYSDVSWTPLFAKAGGVVSESGGMLSHSSIIAREYNIPSVVSVANATRLLKNGDLVTIDGYKGEVILHDTGSQPSLERAEEISTDTGVG